MMSFSCVSALADVCLKESHHRCSAWSLCMAVSWCKIGIKRNSADVIKFETG